MNQQDTTSIHFLRMIGLAKALNNLSAEIRSHSFEPEVYGSWFVIARCNGVRLRIIFDGRDSMYTLERSASRKTPDIWHDTGWQMKHESGTPFPIANIVAEVAQQTNKPTLPD